MTTDEYEKELKKLVAKRSDTLGEEGEYDEGFAVCYGHLDACDEGIKHLNSIKKTVLDSFPVT
jgi:hypothetical protein